MVCFFLLGFAAHSLYFYVQISKLMNVGGMLSVSSMGSISWNHVIESGIGCFPLKTILGTFNYVLNVVFWFSFAFTYY